MNFANDEKWVEWGIAIDRHKFFVLRWHELFAEETFDSWQVRTSNHKTILKEMLTAAETVERYHNSHHNIGWLIAELNKIAKSDLIIQKYFPFFMNYISEIGKYYENYIKNKEKKDADKFIFVVNKSIDSLKMYKDRLVDEIKKILQSEAGGNWQDMLYGLTMSLGIELRSLGYSLAALQESLCVLLDQKISDFVVRYDNMIELFYGNKKAFMCYFMVSWPKLKPDLSGFNVKLLEDRPKIYLNNEQEKFYTQDQEALMAEVSISSCDPFSARYDSEEIIESVFAVTKLYQPNNNAKIRHPLALVVWDGGHKCIDENKTRLKYIKDAKKPDSKITQFSGLISKINKSTSEILSASLGYHKQAVTATTDEARLVNLWIALESIFQYGEESIIERITKHIPQSQSTTYVMTMLGSIPIAIKDLWRRSDTTNLRSFTKKSTKFYLHIHDLLSILLDNEQSDRRKAFEILIENNLMLKYRINRFGKEVFGSPKALWKKIENHRQNVEWQLHRIYRTRNYIMHCGKCPPGTRQLIQNLHSYYIIAIHNIIYDLNQDSSNFTIKTCFEKRKYVMSQFEFRLKNHKTMPVSLEMILNPSLCLDTLAEIPAWGIAGEG